MRAWHFDEKTAGEVSAAGNVEESKKDSGEESKAAKPEEDISDILADEDEVDKLNIVDELMDDKEEEPSPGAKKVSCDPFLSRKCLIIFHCPHLSP